MLRSKLRHQDDTAVPCASGSDILGSLAQNLKQGEPLAAYRVDPDFLPHLASDMTQTLGAIDAHGLQTPIAKHAQHLGIFCTRSLSKNACQGLKVPCQFVLARSSLVSKYLDRLP